MSAYSNDSNERLPEEILNQAEIRQSIESCVPEGLDLSSNVMAAYTESMESDASCEYDFAFISAYFDNEWDCLQTETLKMHSVPRFEAHLPRCVTCNRILGNFLSFGQLYHASVYRKEVALENLDVSSTVMTRYLKVRRQKRIGLVASSSIAAALLFVLFAGRSLWMTNVAPPYQVNGAELQAAMLKDEQAARLGESQGMVAASGTDVMYRSSEAYLFSADSDMMSEDTQNPAYQKDVSSYVMGDW